MQALPSIGWFFVKACPDIFRAVPPAPYQHLGRNVSLARTEKKLTQEQAAEGAGVSLKYWQAIEGGAKAPAFATLRKIRKTLGCSWDRLCAGC
jgi:DNA-binding XRE family transcriptional regulator